MVGIAEALECWNFQSNGLMGLLWQLVGISEAFNSQDCRRHAVLDCQINLVVRIVKPMGFWDCKGMGDLGNRSNGVLGLPKQLIVTVQRMSIGEVECSGKQSRCCQHW